MRCGSSPNTDTCRSFGIGTSVTSSSCEPRDRESIVGFCERTGLDQATITENERADYRFRVTCSDTAFTDFMEATVHDLDYDNFKNRVASTRGRAWHDVLLGIWRLTRNPPRSSSQRSLRARLSGSPCFGLRSSVGPQTARP
jgi:hypothetical protein